MFMGIEPGGMEPECTTIASQFFDESPANSKGISAARSKPFATFDDRQITHLICVRLKHLLYDFLGGVLGLLPVVSLV